MLERQLHVVYRTRDSFVEIELFEDGRRVGSDGVTRCDLRFNRPGDDAVTVSSEDSPGLFELQYPAPIRGRTVNCIRVNLKDVPDPPDNGRWSCAVTIWDVVSVGGIPAGSFEVDIRGLLAGIEFIDYQQDSESNVGLTRQVAMTFEGFSGQNRGIFLYAATTNGNTLANLDTAIFEVEEDGDIIATGSLLPSDQIVFVEVTANCARALIPIGDGGPGNNQVIVRVIYTWTTDGGVTPRRLSAQAAAFRNTNQTDWATPFDEDESYDDFGSGPGEGDPVTVQPVAGDLVVTLAMLGGASGDAAVLSPAGYSDGGNQSFSSFDFNMSYRIMSDDTEQAVDWTSPSSSGGWLLYAAVIRPAG